MLPPILGNFVKGDPGLVWQGQYNALTSYKIGDAVSYAGSSYIAIDASVGIPVTNTDHWQILAEAGTDGSGTGLVSSVNGQIGDVTLAASDVGAATIAQGLLATTAVQQIVGKVLSSNDYTTTEQTKLSTIQQGATLNSPDSVLLNRANQTGTQDISTINNLQSTLSSKVDVVAGKALSTNDYTSAEKTKLTTIATAATANSTDAVLLNRANHTGTQSISTVDGLQAAIDSKVNFIAGKGLSTNDYTTAEKTKLGTLDTASFRGSFVSLAALQAALPTARAGDYAFVDNAGTPALFYIWRTSDSTWQLGTSSSSPALTPAQVKTSYESNANTNAYTDTEKSKLAGIATAATANSPDATLLNRANQTGTQSINTIDGLQPALDAKVATVSGKGLSTNDYTTAEQTKLAGIATAATANSTDAALRDRTTHTGVQAISTVSGLQPALDAKQPTVTGKGLSTNDYTTAEQTKLAGIATGATANSTDALLRDRTTHTGVQAISTVSGLQAALDAKVTTVNGKTGPTVTLTATDVSAASTAQGAKADTAVQTVNGKSGTAITLAASDVGAATAAQGTLASTAVQPAGLTKAAVGLGNVDNTSDVNKPVSTAQAAAIATKASIADSATSGSAATYSIDKILALLAAAGNAPLAFGITQLTTTALAATYKYRTATFLPAAGNGYAYLIYSDGQSWRRVDNPSVVISSDPGAFYVRGVNLSGMEYSQNTLPGSPGTNYFLPTLANFQYWKGKGMNVIRLPIYLARWFDTPGAALNATGKAQLDQVQGYADQTGMQIVLDGHDYATRYVGGATVGLGSSTYTVAQWVSDWTNVATYIQGKSAFYGIDFINEPAGLAIPSSEFNYYPSRPYKQLMRDPQFRNPKTDANWYTTAPFSISATGGRTGGGHIVLNTTTAQYKVIRHWNAGNDTGYAVKANTTYVMSFYVTQATTQGTSTLTINAVANTGSTGAVQLATLAITDQATPTRVSVSFTTGTNQTLIYWDINIQGVIGTASYDDWNLNESTLQPFVPWGSDGTVATITTITNQAIASVRNAGYTGYLLWEGDQASGLMAFGSDYGYYPDIPWIDPLNKTQLSLHYYFDYSGAYTTQWTQASRDLVVPSITLVGNWANDKGVKVFMGEYGVPSDSSTSSVNYRQDLDTAMGLFDTYNFSGTYWAAGDGFSSITSIGPVNGVDNNTVLPIVVKHLPQTASDVPINGVTYNGAGVSYNGSYVTYGN